MERIIFWLESKDSDYFEGLSLYETIPTHNKNLVRNLKRTASAFNKQKLIYELKKYVNTHVKPIPQAITTPATYISKIEVTSPTPVIESIKQEEKKTAPLFHQLPIELRPILLQANNLFKENCLLKTELNDLPITNNTTDTEIIEAMALTIMLKIEFNTKENALAWSKIDYWLEHKQLPPEDNNTMDNWSMDKLIYERSLLESSLSRQRKRLEISREKVTIEVGPALNKLQQKLTKLAAAVLEKEVRLFNIKKLIDGKK